MKNISSQSSTGQTSVVLLPAEFLIDYGKGAFLGECLVPLRGDQLCMDEKGNVYIQIVTHD
ncbi:MAG TPA: hypothetical protein VKV57_03290 [bacterium]|nr:hypothetical protein [bacterium]